VFFNAESAENAENGCQRDPKEQGDGVKLVAWVRRGACPALGTASAPPAFAIGFGVASKRGGEPCPGAPGQVVVKQEVISAFSAISALR
jgi:hypothetical protein